jgi:hypothetical protein
MSDKPSMTRTEYLAGLRSGQSSFDGERNVLNAANRELTGLLWEAFYLLSRASDRKLPASWETDFSQWENKARLALGCPR